MSARRLGVLAVAGLVLVLAGSAPVSLARFRDVDPVTADFGTRQLAPPTGLTATNGTNVALAWTPSTSGWASGYEVFRSATSGTGYASVGTVTPVTASATTDAPATGTWYYVLRTTFQNWTSLRSNEASVVVGGTPTSTGFKDCVNTQAESGGDGNGYQTNPSRACLQDGLVAQDPNSGNTTSNLCLNVGKDRHRFWGYAFGLPASVSSIDGITVNARMGTNTTSGTYGACVQLSWDGGTTWTTHKPITFTTNAMTTYTFGGAADAWGRAWTVSNLDASNFRVRIIDVATVTNKRFDLDWIGVSVDYTP
jgi:hypothetical protein